MLQGDLSPREEQTLRKELVIGIRDHLSQFSYLPKSPYHSFLPVQHPQHLPPPGLPRADLGPHWLWGREGLGMTDEEYNRCSTSLVTEKRKLNNVNGFKHTRNAF